MPRDVVDITGMRFGKLTVVAITNERKGAKVVWEAVCDCGKSIKTTGVLLRRGGSTSCGMCRKKYNDRDEWTRYAIDIYKRAAKQRGLEFRLSYEAAEKIMSSNCFYCGVKPSNSFAKNGKNGVSFTYQGIDRVDNSKGYIEGNCVPCCKVCNKSKSNMSIEEWLSNVERVFNNFIKKVG